MAVPLDSRAPMVGLPDSRVSRVSMVVPPDSRAPTAVPPDSRVSMAVLQDNLVSMAVLPADRREDRVPREAVLADAPVLPAAEDSVHPNLLCRWKRNGCPITIQTRKTISVSMIRNM